MAEGESGFRIASAYVEVSPDTSGFREKLQDQLDEAVAGVHADVTVGLNTDQLDADAEDVKAKVAELDDLRAEPTIAANDDELKAKVDDAKADLDDLDTKRAEATIAANDDDLKAKVDGARADLDDLDGKRAEPQIDAEDADFEAKIASANAQLTALNSRSANPTIGGSGGGAGGAGGAAAGAEAVGEGSLFGALGLGIGSLLPGIGGAAAGLGLLGATGLAAFGGVGKALAAHSQASQNVGITSAQMAATTFSNAVAIQQAQLAVSQAYRQSSQNATMSAEQQESAETQLSETVRNAAASQAQALQGVTQAQQQQQEADFALQTAQYNLSNAWIQARYDLQQLKDEQNDSTASIQAAKVALEAAQYQQKLTDENAMSTSIDRAQAAVAVTQAQEQLTSAQQNATYVAQEYQLQEKAGVAGSQTVLSAKEAEKQALYGVRDAAMAMQDAERNLADTEKNNAAQIKLAILAVKEAQQQSAYQQEQDALAVQQAQKNLSNTYKEQRLELAATKSTSNEALNQFAKDMSRLSAPARQMVDQLLRMHGAWKAIEDIAQGTIAPGITIFLKGIQSILPEIDQGVRIMGRAMGDSFGQFGKLMQTSAFREGLAGLLRNGVQFANIVLPAFAQFLQMLGRVGGQSGAVTGIANLLAGIAHGLTGMTAALRPYIPAISQFLTAIGHILAAIGPPLAVIIGQVANALGPLTRYLDAHPNGTVVKVIGDIVAGLLAFKGLQKLLPDFISGPLGKLASKGGDLLKAPFKAAAEAIPGLLGKAWSAAGSGFIKVFGDGGLVGQGFAKFGGMLTNAGSAVASFVSNMGSQLVKAAAATGTWIVEHAVATGAFIAQNVAMAASATATFIAENAATLGIAAGLAAMIAAVVWTATHWHQVWNDIKHWTLDVWHNVLDPAWQGIKLGITGLYDYTIKPYFEMWRNEFRLVEDAALWLWHNVLDPVWQGIMVGVHGFESTFSAVWSRIEGIFKTPVNFLIGTVYDDGIRRFWNDIVGHIGLSSLKLPEIPKLAQGGIVPGKDTGQDNQLVAMRSGEGVLTPEAVQGIGPGTVHALNKQYSGSGSKSSGSGSSGGGSSTGGKEGRRLGERVARRPAEHLLGFSSGGILGDIGNFFTSAGRDILDSAKFAASFATNPVGTVTSLLDKAIHTPAAGDLGKIMTAIPTTLVHDLAKLVTGSSGPGGSKGGGTAAMVHATGSVLSWFKQAMKLTGAPAAWLPDLETIGWYESGDNPDAINLTDSNAAAGDPSRGVMQTIMSTFTQYHQPGTSMDIYDPIANIAAAIRYIRADYGSPANTPGIISLAHGGGYVGYDSGGWLMPGTLPVNGTGQPEAVLTPSQSAALQALAKWAEATLGNGGQASPLGGVNFNYFGTQYPTVEQRALMKRDLALTLSGAST